MTIYFNTVFSGWLFGITIIACQKKLGLKNERVATSGVNYPEIAYDPWTDLRKREDISWFNLTFPYQQIPQSYQQRIVQAYYAAGKLKKI